MQCKCTELYSVPLVSSPKGWLPDELTVYVGRTLHIKCEARGAQPMVHQWYKDNVPLPYGTHKDLSIENITPEHSGEYRCRVTNEFGQKISLPCRVRVDLHSPMMPQQSQEDSMYGRLAVQILRNNRFMLHHSFHIDHPYLNSPLQGRI